MPSTFLLEFRNILEFMIANGYGDKSRENLLKQIDNYFDKQPHLNQDCVVVGQDRDGYFVKNGKVY